MRLLFTLVKASLLALVPFLLTTLQTANIGPEWHVTLVTPPLVDLLDPFNALVTALFGYEAAIRVIPTEKDRSLVNSLARLLNEYLANRSTGYVSGKLRNHVLAT
jgi:hypothetical protein